MKNGIQHVRQTTVLIVIAVMCIILIYKYDNFSLLCYKRTIYKVSILLLFKTKLIVKEEKQFLKSL